MDASHTQSLKQSSPCNNHSNHHHHCHLHRHHHHHHHYFLIHPTFHHHHPNYRMPPHCTVHNCLLLLPSRQAHPYCSMIREPKPHSLMPTPPLPNYPNTDGSFRASAVPSQVLREEENCEEFEKGDEDDEEPIFVMTEEWQEFFAKSEARRRAANQQAKKQGKKKWDEERGS